MKLLKNFKKFCEFLQKFPENLWEILCISLIQLIKFKKIFNGNIEKLYKKLLRSFVRNDQRNCNGIL